MKYLKDITEERLKAEWKYTFSNQHSINLGNSNQLVQMEVIYSPDCLGFWISIDNVDLHFSHCYENTLKEVIKLSKKYRLELKSMKRIRKPKYICFSSN